MYRICTRSESGALNCAWFNILFATFCLSGLFVSLPGVEGSEARFFGTDPRLADADALAQGPRSRHPIGRSLSTDGSGNRGHREGVDVAGQPRPVCFGYPCSSVPGNYSYQKALHYYSEVSQALTEHFPSASTPELVPAVDAAPALLVL
ncbi:hypothetical protein WJX72_011146 [[Myrmecia] bisecta]|uniref:Transmembrane protein n=1 Tax=[Myrmecia] bisecta TaxID=41462 RepID=A0AAW1QSR8_9CHLO